MSEADMSTSASRPFTPDVPLIAAPIRYGSTVTCQASLAGCAEAGDASTRQAATAAAITPKRFMKCLPVEAYSGYLPGATLIASACV